VLGKIFVPKRDKLLRHWKKVHSEEHFTRHLNNQIKNGGMGGAKNTYEEDERSV
jgi:hypothetical protein